MSSTRSPNGEYWRAALTCTDRGNEDFGSIIFEEEFTSTQFGLLEMFEDDSGGKVIAEARPFLRGAARGRPSSSSSLFPYATSPGSRSHEQNIISRSEAYSPFICSLRITDKMAARRR
ncbi:hypothetical protein FRB97_005410 [Tulasnella sp. 331]|nr:hypothetical protein FRB97_005410 [Tulasnella sp. 331]